MLHCQNTKIPAIVEVRLNRTNVGWHAGKIIILAINAASVEYAKQLIQNHIDRAQESLESLPDTDAKSLMIEIAKLSRGRRT